MTIADVFLEISVILVLSALIATVALLLRQPLIIGFIGVGILVGPSGFGLVRSRDEVDLLARIGIALLLFIVGLRLDPLVIKTVGPVALATGLGQVLFTSAIGLGLCLLLGMGFLTSAYVAVALTFSSTIIIVKLLTEKKEADSLHGQIAIGFLLVQDLVVIAVMIAITASNMPTGGDSITRNAAVFLLRGGALLATAVVVGRFVAPAIAPKLARSSELLSLVAVAWAVGFAGASEYIGFSREIGAFAAGVALSSSPFRDVLSTRLSILRDVLLLFFFIELGAQLELQSFGSQLIPAIFLSLFVLVGNPLIVMIIMGIMGFRRRTGFLAGLAVAQISEFSLIFVRLGYEFGHVSRETIGLVTLVGMITIGLSTYLILYSEPIFLRLAPLLGVFERSNRDRESGFAPGRAAKERSFDVAVFGAGRHGSEILRVLTQRGIPAFAVDFSPDEVRKLTREGLAVIYGDVEDPDYYSFLPLEGVEWVICTIPGHRFAGRIQALLQGAGINCKLAFTAHVRTDEEKFAALNADHVFNPFREGAESLVNQLGLEYSAR